MLTPSVSSHSLPPRPAAANADLPRRPAAATADLPRWNGFAEPPGDRSAAPALSVPAAPAGATEGRRLAETLATLDTDLPVRRSGPINVRSQNEALVRAIIECFQQSVFSRLATYTALSQLSYQVGMESAQSRRSAAQTRAAGMIASAALSGAVQLAGTAMSFKGSLDKDKLLRDPGLETPAVPAAGAPVTPPVPSDPPATLPAAGGAVADPVANPAANPAAPAAGAADDLARKAQAQALRANRSSRRIDTGQALRGLGDVAGRTASSAGETAAAVTEQNAQQEQVGSEAMKHAAETLRAAFDQANKLLAEMIQLLKQNGEMSAGLIGGIRV